MIDYLDSLISQSVGAGAQVRPRIRALFEPVSQASVFETESVSAEDSTPESKTSKTTIDSLSQEGVTGEIGLTPLQHHGSVPAESVIDTGGEPILGAPEPIAPPSPVPHGLAETEDTAMARAETPHQKHPAPQLNASLPETSKTEDSFESTEGSTDDLANRQFALRTPDTSRDVPNNLAALHPPSEIEASKRNERRVSANQQIVSAGAHRHVRTVIASETQTARAEPVRQRQVSQYANTPPLESEEVIDDRTIQPEIGILLPGTSPVGNDRPPLLVSTPKPNPARSTEWPERKAAAPLSLTRQLSQKHPAPDAHVRSIEPQEAEPPSEVHVNIGRIEIKGNATSPPKQSQPLPSQITSLDEYLRGRQGGRG